jgi:hypothetical protein
MQVLPDDVCWRIHELVAHVQVVHPTDAAQNLGPKVTGGGCLDDEETDIE